MNAIQLVILLPLLGAIVQTLLGRSLSGTAGGRRVLGILAVVPIALAFLVSLSVFKELADLAPNARNVVVAGPDWIAAGGFRMPFEWVVDPLSMTMVLVITGIGALIHLYSTGYMAEEPEYGRFFAYLNLFIASMLVLVLGNNLGLLFIGWEGVGLCSYLLIGFWYRDASNVKAGNKAFIANRVGDWSLTLGMFLIFVVLVRSGLAAQDGRMLSFDVMLPALESALKAEPIIATAIGLLLFGGAAGKSAQFPLYVWLPDAMAGPTPVSALIHAATMVTSGVVLLTRMNVVFASSPTASAIVAAIGAFTALFAAVIALAQTDIKKVLAYSTVSQLGFMFIGVGVGAAWTGMFHVVTHAFFKALLFLSAGAVIHAMAHEQDMRRYGNLRKYLPITFVTMMLGWLAISAIAIPGVFGFAGAISKETILGAAFDTKRVAGVGDAVGWIGLFVAVLTAFYMTRMFLVTFLGKEERWRSLPEAHHHDEDSEHHHVLTREHRPHEVGLSMALPLIVLAILSVVGGVALHHPIEAWLASVAPTEVKSHTTELPLEIISAVAAVVGVLAGFAVYARGFPKREMEERDWSGFRRRASGQFGVDTFTTEVAVQGGGDLGRGLWKVFDVGLVDGAIRGAGSLATNLGGALRGVQRGYVRVYALLMLVGVVGFVGWFAVQAGVR